MEQDKQKNNFHYILIVVFLLIFTLTGLLHKPSLYIFNDNWEAWSDNNISFNGTATIFGNLTVTDTIEASDWSNVSINLSQVSVLKLGNVSEVVTAEDAYRRFWSAGSISGFNLTENDDGTVNISSGEAVLRSSPIEDAELISMNISGIDNFVLVNNSVNYIFANYNSGSPIVDSGTSINDFNCIDKCLLWTVSREHNLLYVVDGRNQNVDANRKNRRRLLETQKFQRVLGGSIIGNEGNLSFSLTSGAFYSGLERIDHQSFDTSSNDTFQYYYRDSLGGWNIIFNNSKIDNQSYDDDSGVLALLGNNKFGVHWVYLILNQPSKLGVVYGQQEYDNIADAQASQSPAELPPAVAGTGILIGRIIIEEDGTEFDAIESAFTEQFVAGTPTTHNSLAGLQGGTLGEFFHLESSEHTELTQWIDNVVLESNGNLNMNESNITSYDGYFLNNVGIGTSTPQAELHVNGSTNINGNLNVTGTSTSVNLTITNSLNMSAQVGKEYKGSNWVSCWNSTNFILTFNESECPQ